MKDLKVLILATLALFVGCEGSVLDVKIKTISSISGKAFPFAPPNFCESVEVNLFRLTSDGQVIYPAVATNFLLPNGSYELTGLESLGITTNTTPATFFLQAVGCNEVHTRFISSATNQDITIGSSLLSFIIGTDLAINLDPHFQTRSGDLFDDLLESLSEARSLNEAYFLLTSGEAPRQLFNKIFEGTAEVLLDAPPQFAIPDLPESFNEGEVYTLTTKLFHWNPDYSPVAEWYRESTLINTGASLTFTLRKNDQNSLSEFSLKVGKDDGSAAIDPTLPQGEFPFARPINNNYLPEPPPTILGSAPYTRKTVVSLVLSTGANFENCESFDWLALTESPQKPTKAEVLAQNRSCADPNSQVLDHGLSDLSDGTKYLYLWAMDASDNISSTPEILFMNLHSAAPELEFQSPSDNSSHATSVLITGTCEEPFDVMISGSGTPTAIFASCTVTGFSANINLTAGVGSKTINISQTDYAGNTVSRTRTFNRTTP